MKKITYFAPIVDATPVRIERGFALSTLGGPGQAGGSIGFGEDEEI